MIFSDSQQKSDLSNSCYEFDIFHVNPCKRVLKRKGLVLPLPSKAFDTLLVLIEGRDHIVEKDELLSRLWGDRFVAENNLNQKISILRRALGEGPRHHQYIVTIPGQGYRFVAEVREVICSEAPGGIPESVVAENRRTIKSIAVLPFKMLGVEEDTYWGLSLTDALITRLSKLGQMIVPATSTVAELSADDDLTAVREKLKIDVVLEGRIRRDGRKIRLTVQLVSTNDGVSLWADQFDEVLTDWLTLEDKLAGQILSALQNKLRGF